jgi:hypothetical protein
MPDLTPFEVPEGGLIECKNRLPYDDNYRKMADKQDYSIVGLSSTTFTGSGLDDGTIGGTYTGTTQIVYKVVIDATGTPDTFEWFKDGVSQASGVAITGAAQTLDNGITVTFAATTGHTNTDFWSATAYAAVTSDTPQNAVQYQAVDGNNYLFVGTGTKLHRMGASNKYFEDVTRTASNYSTGTNLWSFLQWGDYAIATNFADDPQVMTSMDTDANFVALSTLDETPPKGKYLLQHKGHIILAHVNDGAAKPKRIVWSGLEDPSKWTASLTNGAGGQTFADSGDITGIANVGDSFAILHTNSISVGRYSGAPYTFVFEHNRVKNIGCEYPGSVISIGDRIFFWGNDDIYEFDGNAARGIGFGVKETIIPNINASYTYRITAMHDEINGIVFWSWANADSTDGNYTRILCYNYRVKRYTWLDTTGECIFGFKKGAVYNPDDMTNIYTEYVEGVTPADAVILEGFSDSSEWQSGGWVFASIDTDNVLNTYDNSFLTGVITSGEFKVDDNVLMVDRVRPNASAYSTNPIVRVGSRMEENDGVSYTALSTVGSNGYADLRSSGRYHRVEITLGDDAGIMKAEAHAKSRGFR